MRFKIQIYLFFLFLYSSPELIGQGLNASNNFEYRELQNYRTGLTIDSIDSYLKTTRKITEQRETESIKPLNNQVGNNFREQKQKALFFSQARALEKHQRQFYISTFLLMLVVLLFIILSISYYQIKVSNEEIQNQHKIISQQSKELRQLDQAKSRFFANVSHELRTPITLIMGPISSVLKTGDLSDKDYFLLKKAQKSTKDLLKLVGAILDLTKLEAEKMTLNKQAVLLFPFLQYIVSIFEILAVQRDIYFTFNYKGSKELRLEVDKEKLEVIINNLLSNAFKFTQNKGKITIECEDEGDKIKLAVSDTGRGIHPDDIDYIFDRYYQYSDNKRAVEGGTGIGLTISKEYIQLMQGKVWVESELNRGSIFYIEFPRIEVLGQAQVSDKLVLNGVVETKDIYNEIPSFIKNRRTILIVEDNYNLRVYFASTLSKQYNVHLAENGQVALDLLMESLNDENLKIDLVLSDILMPEMDGYQLLTIIKSRDYFCHIPVIMLTAKADTQGKLKALRIGIDDYLLKPFEEEELIARIENVFLNNRKHQVESKIISEQNENMVMSTEANSDMLPSKRTTEDLEWLGKLEDVVKMYLASSNTKVSALAEEMIMSERQFHRKVKQLTGKSPGEYFKEARLIEARRLLEKRLVYSVKSAAFSVGFKNPEYFSIQFKKRFGKTPSEYLP